MTTVWENPDHDALITHLRTLRRRGRIRTVGSVGCTNCRGVARTILVDGQRRVVYSEPCLACRGGGTTEKADLPV